MKKAILLGLTTLSMASTNLLSVTDTRTQPTKSDIAAEKLAKLLSTRQDWVSSAENTCSISKNVKNLLTKIKDNTNKNLETKLYKAVIGHLNKMIKNIEGIEAIKTETLEEIVLKSKEVLVIPVKGFLKPLHAAQSLVRNYVEDIMTEDETIKEIKKITGKDTLIFQFLDTDKKSLDTFFEKELDNSEKIIQLCLEIKSLTDPIFKFI